MNIISTTGIRDLHIDDHPTVIVVIEAFARRFPKAQFHFGGARGVDTLALLAAVGAGVHTKVIVPFTIDKQPYEAQRAISYASEVQEMKLPQSVGTKGFLIRNEALIHPANLVLAFTDGRLEGGTYHAMGRAKNKIVKILVRNTRFDPMERPR